MNTAVEASAPERSQTPHPVVAWTALLAALVGGVTLPGVLNVLPDWLSAGLFAVGIGVLGISLSRNRSTS